MADAALTLGTSAFANYLLSTSAWTAVFIPGTLSLTVVALYARAGRLSRRLQLLWLFSLPITLVCMRWEYTDDMHQLYIYSAFSVGCMMILFKRMYIPPLMAYALTFLSLCLVDLTAAFRHAIDWNLPPGDLLLRGRRSRYPRRSLRDPAFHSSCRCVCDRAAQEPVSNASPLLIGRYRPTVISTTSSRASPIMLENEACFGA